MMGRAGSWVGNTVSGLTMARFWLYQDFVAGSGPSLTITGNDNGSGGAFVFNATNIVDSSAVVTKTNGNPIFTNVAELPSQLVSVSAHTGASVTLDSTPAAGEGAVRIWYLYAMSSEDAPNDFEIAPHFVKEVRSSFLDNQYLNQALNLSDLTNAATARSNLGFTSQTAGQVLFGTGSTDFTSESNLFWDSSNDRLGIGTNSPSQSLHLFKAGATTALIETSLTSSNPSLRLQASRTSTADLAAADTAGVLETYGHFNGSFGQLTAVSTVYQGNGTTQKADLVFSVAQTGAPSEVLRINSSGQIDTTLGAGAVQSNASGILSSSTLTVANGGTNATSFTAGSVIFAGAGGTSLTEDNTNLFWDDTNNRLAIGPVGGSPTYKLHIKAEPSGDNMLRLEADGASSHRFYDFGVDSSGFFHLAQSGAGFYAFTISNSGDQVGIGQYGGIASTTFAVYASAEDHCPIVAKGFNGGSANLQQWRKSDDTVFSYVDSTGNIFAPIFHATTSVVFEDPGAGTNTVTIQAGTVSSSYAITLPTAQAATANDTLLNNGSGVLTWGRQTVHKAGQVTLTSGTTSKAISFATTFGSTNYSIHAILRNTTDGSPIHVPLLVIAKAATGFTVEWSDALPSSNYALDWSILGNYDP